MTRQEENEILIAEMIKRANEKPDGTFEIIAFQLGCMVSILADMSKNLAIIADKEICENKESEE